MEGGLFSKFANPTDFVDSFSTQEVSITFLDSTLERTVTLAFDTGALAPYHTLEDIARAVWIQMDSADYYPDYVFYGVNMAEEGQPLQIQPLMGHWYTADTEDVKDAILLPDPRTIIQTQRIEAFVDDTGERKQVRFPSRGRMTIEDVFLKPFGKIPQLVAITFETLRSMYAGATVEIPPADFYGKFYPYFPTISQKGPYQLPTEAFASVALEKVYCQQKLEQTEFLNYLADEAFQQGFPTGLKVTGYRYLTFQWKQDQRNQALGWEGADTLFYSVPADERRPFMRFLTPSTIPMTKLYKPNDLEPPFVNDVTLLRQWIQERSPTETDSVLFLKLLFRQGTAGLFPLYGTVRIFDTDGSADFTLQPPKGVRLLSFQQDTPPQILTERLQKAMEDTPYTVEQLEFARGTLHLAFTLPSDMEAMTRETLRARIAKISTLFQEIPAPPDESPFFSMRYKAVSNFVREDTVSMFLTMLDNRDKGKDRDYIGALSREFGFSREEAEAKAVAWRNEAVKVSVVDAETRDYKVDANPGTDIVMYAQATSYTFHIYRLESLEDFRRIYTLLYLLFFLSEVQWDEETNSVSANLSPEVSAQAEASAVPARTVEPKAQVLDQIPEGLEESPSAEIALDFDFDAPTPEEKAENQIISDGFRQTFQEPDKEAVKSAKAVEKEAVEAAAESRGIEEAPLPVVPPVTAVAAGAPGAPGVVAAIPAGSKSKPSKATTAKAKKGDTGQLVASGYFIKRLKEIDPALFTQKVAKGQAYTSQCQANWDRQPAVLSQEQYDAVKRIYRDDARMAILTLGLPRFGYKTAEEERVAQTKPKKIWMMRFGSDTMHMNYYVCAEFFCLKDMLPIHRDDWNDTEDLEGATKPKQSCPVCHGLAIKNREKVAKGETVIARKAEPNGVQAYIGFLGKSHHPAGYHLPCCFTAEKKIKWEDDKFGHLRRALEATEVKPKVAPTAAAAPVAPSVAAAAPVATVATVATAAPDALGGPGAAAAAVAALGSAPVAETAPLIIPAPKGKELVTSKTCHDITVPITVDNVIRFFSTTYKSYDGLRTMLSNENIVDFEKYPLRPGVVGLCPPGLDAYFAQESITLVHRPKITQVIKPTSMGFFRVGVLNDSPFLQRQSFFAALAPYLHKNTIQEVMEHICASITPKIFLQLNFGNLLLEFYRPEDPLTLSKQELQNWCKSYIGQALATSEFELRRLYKSYKRFIEYVFDPQQIKQARHFMHALMEPGVLTSKGLNLIVLEYTLDPRVDAYKTHVHVKCPLQGFNIDRYIENDVGFITYNTEGIWEPLIYVSRPNPKNETPMRQEASFVLTYEQIFSNVSPIVVDRYREYATQCRSTSLGAYTAQRGVDSRTLLPLSRALTELRPSGIVKDIYNHTYAITLDTSILAEGIPVDEEEEAMIPKTGISVLFPVADDGIIPTSGVQIHVTVDSVSLASAEEVEEMYDGSRVYTLQSFLQLAQKGKGAPLIVGFTLGNRSGTLQVNLPCGRKATTERLTIPVKTTTDRFVLEYKLNRTLYISTAETETREESPFLLKRQYAEDLYQHFRLIFSNWLQRNKEAKDVLHEILMDEFLPSFEKRYRIQLLFVPEMLRWLRKDPEEFDPPDDILLRKDCISIQDPGRCTGYCRWKQSEGEGDEGRCLLHTPEQLTVRDINDGPQTIRLKDKVAALPKTVDAGYLLTTRLVDELVRLPAKRYELMMKQVSRIQIPTHDVHQGTQWYLPENTPAWDELLRGSSKLREQPMYWEEFSRETEGEPVRDLPAALKQYLKPAAFGQIEIEQFSENPDIETPLEGFFALFESTLGTPIPEDYFGKPAPRSELSDIQIRRLSQDLKRPVVQILFAGDTAIITGYTDISKQYYDSVILYLPNLVEGGAILRDSQSGSYLISAGLLTPALTSQIKVPERVVIRKKTAK